jgi:hypothetical protein
MAEYQDDGTALWSREMIPVTDAHRYIQTRTYPTDEERNFALRFGDRRWPHIRPNSCLVTPLGFHWSPGSWQKVIDMIEYTNSLGVYCALSEIQDRCFEPYDALGTMRNECIIMAQNEGYEFLLYLDNDVLPEKDCLIRLLSWGMPIVAPMVKEPGTGKPLYGPTDLVPNTGLKPARWTVLSMLLFMTNVFNCVGPRFWGDAIGADEGYHFQTLWRYGHRPYIDTNIQLDIKSQPHYPLASNRMSQKDRAEHWEKINMNRNKPPDRKPIWPYDSRNVIDGEYLPFSDLARQAVWGVKPKSAISVSNGQMSWRNE